MGAHTETKRGKMTHSMSQFLIASIFLITVSNSTAAPKCQVEIRIEEQARTTEEYGELIKLLEDRSFQVVDQATLNENSTVLDFSATGINAKPNVSQNHWEYRIFADTYILWNYETTYWSAGVKLEAYPLS